MKRTLAAVAIVAAALMVVSCSALTKSTPTSPSGTTGVTDVNKVLTTGSWASASTSSTFSPSTCGNFEWAISSLTTTSASGTFKAVCGNGLTLQGNAEGVLNGTTATVIASGTASTAGTSCPFALSATAIPASTTSIKVSYTGSVCGVPVSGTETLSKK